MAQLHSHSLRLFDQCVSRPSDLAELRAALELIEKCCQGVQRKINLADALSNPGNRKALLARFGQEGYEIALQLILRVALQDFHRKSFTVHQAIDGPKLDMLYRAVGGWKQFEAVVTLTLPEAGPGGTLKLFNPAKTDQWRKLGQIPAGALVSVYLKTAGAKRSREQEQLAGDRYKTIFETIAAQIRMPTEAPKPVVRMDRYRKTTTPKPSYAPKTVDLSGGPTFSFKVAVSKIDTFVHAGNAQLIVAQVREFHGTVQMYVLRGERKRVSLDPDSIWSAEIRNGEIVLFEFFGGQPDEQFVKDLAAKVNKYTQMDKLVHG